MTVYIYDGLRSPFGHPLGASGARLASFLLVSSLCQESCLSVGG